MQMLLGTIGVAALLGPPALAQKAMARSELAWRLQALEGAWEGAGAAAREQALPRVEAAVQSFFGFDFAGAAVAMDAGRSELRGAAPLAGWTVGVENRLATGGAYCTTPAELPALRVELAAGAEPAEGLELGVRWQRGERVLYEAPFAAVQATTLVMPQGVAEQLGDKPAGVQGVLVGRSNGVREERACEFVWAAPPPVTLAAYRFGVDQAEHGFDAFGRASAVALIDLFEGLRSGEVPEVELPLGDWMLALGRRMEALVDDESWLGVSTPGDHLVAFPRKRRPTPARLFVPEGLDADAPVPLVVALHGAGGSEHMFFEAYGNGKLVELARARGWIVVSPYHALLVPPDVEGMVAALVEVLPVDPQRVAVVGHSMGALAGLGAAERGPHSIAALVAMGGGRAPKDAGALAGLPVHVAVGEHDFGRRGGEALHAALGEVERSAELELHVVLGSEHLMVVQDGLERAFAFLDRVL